MVVYANPIENVTLLLLIASLTEMMNSLFDPTDLLTMMILANYSLDRMYSRYLDSCCLKEMSNSR